MTETIVVVCILAVIICVVVRLISRAMVEKGGVRLTLAHSIIGVVFALAALIVSFFIYGLSTWESGPVSVFCWYLLLTFLSAYWNRSWIRPTKSKAYRAKQSSWTNNVKIEEVEVTENGFWNVLLMSLLFTAIIAVFALFLSLSEGQGYAWIVALVYLLYLVMYMIRLVRSFKKAQVPAPALNNGAEGAQAQYAGGGDDNRQYQLGMNYLNSGNYKKALKAFKAAADQGSAEGMKSVGDCYYQGYGVKEDPNTALNWWLNAYNHGSIGAAYSMGLVYEEYRDDNEAVKWYSIVAQQGYPEAQSRLANIYYRANMYNEAAVWADMAARQGDAEAQSLLGLMYSLGQGVPQNNEMSFRWYLSAAQQGDADAQCMVGMDYTAGLGVAKDLSLARQWLNRAASQGNQDAINFLNQGLVR